MLTFRAIGRWLPHQLELVHVASSRPSVPEVEAMIDLAWREATARPGANLFDGPMCRLESSEAAEHTLTLRIAATSYREFFGTNLTHPELSDRYGERILANPVGVSPALISSDNYLLLGRRNDSVAYYPNRLHPFAGSLEPRDRLDVFDEVRRELLEELSLSADAVNRIVCTGIVEDHALRHPELMFAAWSSRSREQIIVQLDAAEHCAGWSVPAEADVLAQAVANEPLLTPVARAAMLLFGRIQFGDAWFDAARYTLPRASSTAEGS